MTTPFFVVTKEGTMRVCNFPMAFMDIETLAERWRCRIATIQALAETEQLKVCIRPVALEIALEGLDVGMRPKILKVLSQHTIDRTDIYRLFSDQTTPIPLKNFDSPDLQIPPIYARFKDLVVDINTILAFEIKYEPTAEEENTFAPLNEDCTVCIWNGHEQTFGMMQARIIKMLWQARESGDPWIYGKVLLAKSGAGSDRLRGIFGRRNQYWRNLIVSDQKGRYKLNLPLKAI